MPPFTLTEKRRAQIEAALMDYFVGETGTDSERFRQAFIRLPQRIPELACMIDATKEELQAFGWWMVETLLACAEGTREDDWGGG